MTPNYDTWSEEEKRQVYFSLCAEVDKLRADAARLRSERDTLAKRVRELRDRLRDLMSHPAAMAQIGPIARGLAEGAIMAAEVALAPGTEPPEAQGREKHHWGTAADVYGY